MAPKKVQGPLTDQEATARINKLVDLIEGEALKEASIIQSHSQEENDELSRTHGKHPTLIGNEIYRDTLLHVPCPRKLVNEPRDVVDEWIEKLRAFTERHTRIHKARLRRIAKLQMLEAFGSLRDEIKNQARESIKMKMSQQSHESDLILGAMLCTGVLKLMENKVLVHTTRADVGRVIRFYDKAIKLYKEATGTHLQLITSRHPLKDDYYGRIVVSDKKSTIFVDVNLFSVVDKVADEVFSLYHTFHWTMELSRDRDVEELKRKGLIIMPKGVNIQPARLETILSRMHGDPRDQSPVFQLKEEPKKETITQRRNVSQLETNTQTTPRQRKGVQLTDTPLVRRNTLESTTHSQTQSRFPRAGQGSENELMPKDMYNFELVSSVDLFSDSAQASRSLAPINDFGRGQPSSVTRGSTDSEGSRKRGTVQSTDSTDLQKRCSSEEPSEGQLRSKISDRNSCQEELDRARTKSKTESR